MLRFPQGATQAKEDKAEETAVEFAAGMEVGDIDSRSNGGGITLHCRGKTLPHHYQAAGRRKYFPQFFDGAYVMGEDRFPGHLQRSFSRFSTHMGIAVPVAADPRTETDHCRQVAGRKFNAVSFAERLGNLLVKAGKRGNEGAGVVVNPHPDLVADFGAAAPHHVGLPEGGDLGQDRLLSSGRQ